MEEQIDFRRDYHAQDRGRAPGKKNGGSGSYLQPLIFDVHPASGIRPPASAEEGGSELRRRCDTQVSAQKKTAAAKCEFLR